MVVLSPLQLWALLELCGQREGLCAPGPWPLGELPRRELVSGNSPRDLAPAFSRRMALCSSQTHSKSTVLCSEVLGHLSPSRRHIKSCCLARLSGLQSSLITRMSTIRCQSQSLLFGCPWEVLVGFPVQFRCLHGYRCWAPTSSGGGSCSGSRKLAHLAPLGS